MTLLTMAYGVYADQVFGPGWLTSERYTVDAIIPAGASERQFGEILQNLLVQRFKLALRRQERDFTVYNLVVAASGPRLRPAAAADGVGDAEDAEFAPGMSTKVELDVDGCPLRRPGSRGSVGSVGEDNCTTFRRYSISDFIKVLEMMVAIENGSYFGSQASQAHIIDRTGLRGEFDFNLKFNLASRIPGTMLGMPAAGDASDPAGGSGLFKALETQLGLKLEKTKSRLGTLIVQEAVKVPTEN